SERGCQRAARVGADALIARTTRRPAPGRARIAGPLRGIPVMTRLVYLSIVAAAALVVGCVVAPYPYPYPTTTVSSPPSFDRSWDAALGAAADVGVQITNADRASG